MQQRRDTIQVCDLQGTLSKVDTGPLQLVDHRYSVRKVSYIV